VSRRGNDVGKAAAPAPLDRAAELLRKARRVLVTGLADATLEGVQAACDLAETLGAAIDPAADDAARPTGPLVARVGAVTAEFEELRDRADLVILWSCDPEACRPGFSRAFLEPGPATGRPRRLIAVGPEGVAGRHLAVPRESLVDAARLLHALVVGQEASEAPASVSLADACRTLLAAVRDAECVGVVTCRDDDPLGLSHWAVSLLVRAINRERPAFVVPLGDTLGGLDDAAGAAAVLTWRYGAAGAVARADRSGGDFRPSECSAAALVARGEVDAVVVIGGLPVAVEEAIAGRAADLAVVRIDERVDVPPGCAGECVHLRTSAAAGTILRPDGREEIRGDSTAADGPVAILVALRERLTAGRIP